MRQETADIRDYLERWGMLARVVLESWSITSTVDFGRIVFGFIAFDMMQKQPGDQMEDFEDVFTFEDAFDETFRAGLREAGADRRVP